MKRPKRAVPVPPAAADRPPPAEWTTARVALLFAALLLATLAVYQPAWHGGFLWDDDAHVTEAALRSWDGLRRIWFDLGATQQYYPLTHSTFWLMHRLWGDGITGYHLVNILLHALSACLVAVILWRLEVPGAVLAAAIFALHPVHVESVAWITELKNTLSGALYLGATLAYLRFDERRSSRAYALAAALFVLALLSKTVTATWPAAMLVIAWWRRGRIDWRRDALPLAPFVVVGAASGLLTAWVEHAFIGAGGAEFQFTLIERALIAGRAIWFYLVTLLWPANLMFVYPKWAIRQDAWWQYLYPLAALVLLAACWAWRRRARAPLAALLLFIFTLAPALGFVNVYPFRFSFVADHFQYLASIAMIALVSAGITRAARRWAGSSLRVQTAVVLAVAAPLAVLSWRESHQYVDAETLYRTTIARNPDAWMAHHNLAVLKLDGSAAELKEAIAHVTEALRLNPADADSHSSLGYALQREGRLEDAAAQYAAAIRLQPGLAAAHNNLGTVRQAEGRLDEAAAHYANALRLKPEYGEAHRNLGLVLQEFGRIEEAVAHLQEAVRLEPGSAVAHDSLGTARLRQRRLDDAVKEYRAAIALDASYHEAYNNLGLALAQLGRFDEAAAAHREAIRLKPDASRTHDNLGHVLLRLDRAAEAETEFREAIRLQPDNGRALYDLANLLQTESRLDEAVVEYREALRQVSGPLAANVHNDLGVALAGLGRLPEAREQFQAALGIMPDFPDARANLARVGGKVMR
jgi:tetratricopeptide (TPR) repeat protein